jgi:hypothetical protein
MNTQAIERIKGYCCEVTQEQWEELVRVADEVGLTVGAASRNANVFSIHCAMWSFHFWLIIQPSKGVKIPFPDFLAKLKGEEWQPKAGEMVEVSDDRLYWVKREFLTERHGKLVCWGNLPNAETHRWLHIRPLRPTITRTEAEALLNKRIID